MVIPLLGGSDIDRVLKQQFPNAPVNLLRFAKEEVSPSNPDVPVAAGVNLSWEGVEATLKAQKFMPLSLTAHSGFLHKRQGSLGKA